MKTFTAAAGVLALASLLGACDLAFSNFHEEATESWSKTFPLTATGRLEIANTNGRITVEAGGGADVEARAVRKARGATKEAAAENLKNVTIRETASPDLVKLETSIPSMHGGSASVDYIVRVPAGATVSLQSSNGEISITAVSGPVEMRTNNGTVEGHQLGGPVKARTNNGKVDVELAALTGDVTLGTNNGEVSLTLPKSSKADFNLELNNGEIEVEGFTVEGEKSRRRVNGTVNGGGSHVKADTTNGAIRIIGR
jgi:DUF4097 and DUF4098 domain-containing protein YvlB